MKVSLSSNLFVCSNNDKKVNKKNRLEDIRKSNVVALNSIKANQFGVSKSLINSNYLSFGVKRENIIAPNLTKEEIEICHMKPGQLSLEQKEYYKQELSKRNNIIADYCIRLMLGEELEDLNTDEKCENYITIRTNEIDLNIDRTSDAFLEGIQNQLNEGVDAIYNSINDALPQNSADISAAIQSLKSLQTIKNIAITQHLSKSKNTTTYSEDNKNIRYLILGEIAREDKSFLGHRNNLYKLCAFATINSMLLDDLKNIIASFDSRQKKVNQRQQSNMICTFITNNKISPKILNILKGSELVFQNFNDEDRLDSFYTSSINLYLLDIILDLGIKLLEKHLEIVKAEEAKQEANLNFDDIFQDFDEPSQKTKASPTKKKKKKETPKSKGLSSKPVQIDTAKETIKKEKETTSIELNSEDSLDEFYKNIEEDGEFKLVGVTLDNSLTDLDNKKLFSKIVNEDSTHERYMASSEVVQSFFNGLIDNESLDVGIKNHIKFNPKAEGDKHFVGAFLARLKDRNPYLKLSEAIEKLVNILNNGVLVHSLTQEYNAKLEVYSYKDNIMIPLMLDEQQQCIHLKTMLDFQDPDQRKTRLISNPKSDKLNSYGTLDTFYSKLVENTTIPTHSLKDVLNQGFNYFKKIYTSQH